MPGHPVDRLLEQQSGVATLTQLTAAGMTSAEVTAHVDARRWTRVGGRCVVGHNADLSRRQWMWVSVLDNRVPAALAGFSALELRGFTFFGSEPAAIHVVVPRGAQYHRLPGVTVHESRRFDPADVVVTGGPPRLPAARSAVDAAAWQPHPRYATAVLAAVVQQRVATVRELDAALATVGRVRHKQPMRLALRDIAGGAEALSELDVAALCRRASLRPPARQRIRRDRDGRRRYLDCEWLLDDGRVVVLEVDGSHHATVASWEEDMRRERQVVVGGRAVLRASAGEVRHDPAALVADLLAVGVPRVVRGGEGQSPLRL